jgi:hypothetical protein
MADDLKRDAFSSQDLSRVPDAPELTSIHRASLIFSLLKIAMPWNKAHFAGMAKLAAWLAATWTLIEFVWPFVWQHIQGGTK